MWREWRGVAGNDGGNRVDSRFHGNDKGGVTSVARMAGIHASNPARGAGMPVLPPVIPVKTGIHASNPDHGAGIHASNPARGAGMPVLPPSFP